MKIYSMPEGFLTDQEVPVRWRLLGILNGFHINGKDLYASNDWLARQLDCSERSISNGVKELEARGEVYCERTDRTRIIKRTLVDESQGGVANGFYPPSKRLLPPSDTPLSSESIVNTPPNDDKNPVKGSKRLLPNSINADNILGATRMVTEIDEEKPSRTPKPKYPHSKEVFSWFPKPEKSWALNTTELTHAELLFERGEERVKKALKFIQSNREDEFCPKVVKPSDLERKWNDITEYARRTK